MQPSPLASYNRLWSFVTPFAILHLHSRAWRGREDKKRLKERYGRYSQERPKGRLFWLHAVSVGESVAALTLATCLRDKRPDVNILITTNTITAATRIAEHGDNAILHGYQPLDNPQWVERFLDHWQPDYAVMLESDFWPNLICATAARNIPLCFASAQLSDKAYQAWQKRALLARIIFSAPQDIFTVDTQQADKFRQLAGDKNQKPHIQIGGSLKVAPASLPADAALVAMLSEAADTRPILLAASTHKGEDELILAASKQASDSGLAHFLIIAPRHPERGNDIAAKIQNNTQTRPGQRSKGDVPQQQDNVFICDSLGEMGSLYKLANIIILGGSFVDVGGHNPLEIALFETPILAGPSRFKNKDAFDSLSKAGLIELAEDEKALGVLLADKLDALKKGHALITAKNKTKIAAITTEACSRAAKTADYLLDNLSQKTVPKPLPKP